MNKELFFKQLRENRDLVFSEKKSAFKKADSVFFNHESKKNDRYSANKDKNQENNAQNFNSINVKLAINTTNILDSHSDVHIPGIWDECISEKKYVLLLQEHCLKFDHVITDVVTPSAIMVNWSDLGFQFKGKTQVLQFDATIGNDRNPYMFDLYLRNWVKQHSVGMMYKELFLCVNSEDKYFRDEKENWDKYLPIVVNQDDAIENGYFWAVTKADFIEGSAVVLGSNYATPIINMIENTNENTKNMTYEDFNNLLKQTLNL